MLEVGNHYIATRLGIVSEFFFIHVGINSFRRLSKDELLMTKQLLYLVSGFLSG